MRGRVAIVIFTTDAIRGTGRGLTGTFTSSGMSGNTFDTGNCPVC